MKMNWKKKEEFMAVLNKTKQKKTEISHKNLKLLLLLEPKLTTQERHK